LANPVLIGHEIEVTIEELNLFEYIRDNQDDFLWDKGFRPAFSKEEYLKYDESSRISLVPPSKFIGLINPMDAKKSKSKKEEINEIINGIAESIESGAFKTKITSEKYILKLNPELDFVTLLPKWYTSVVDIKKIDLREFKFYIEDEKEAIKRDTEVNLINNSEGIFEITIKSHDLALAEKVVESVLSSIK